MAFSTEIFGANTGTSIAKRKAAAAAGEMISEQGRNGDSMTIHASPFTMNLLKRLGGAGTTNPDTGMLEFYNIDEAVRKKMGY
tara:strand:+ start:177 stop:425 length:249 start_codon:yes stop_codon:yes gene_type:complete